MSSTVFLARAYEALKGGSSQTDALLKKFLARAYEALKAKAAGAQAIIMEFLARAYEALKDAQILELRALDRSSRAPTRR